MLYDQYFTDDLKNPTDIVRGRPRRRRRPERGVEAMKRGLLLSSLLLLLTLAGVGQDVSGTSLVDEFSNPNCEDIWARLDNFLTQLNNNPMATATISMSAKRGEARDDLYYETMMRNYFITRKVALERWRIIRTKAEESRIIRFWLTPPGARLPMLEVAAWSLEYPLGTKPFIFTNGENYMVEVTVCLYVNELDLLAKVLAANPHSRTNVVLIVKSKEQFYRRKKQVLRKLVGDYSISSNRIKFFQRINRRPNPYGIRSDAEYWFVL